MKCKKCGETNGEAKRTCGYCGAFLEGECFNNVTGEFGYRDSNGMFHSYQNGYTVKDWIKTLGN
jgi:hypothetical protein